MFSVSSSVVSGRIVQFLSFGLFCFICGFFLFPSVSAHKTAYYLVVVLPFLLLIPWLRWRTPTPSQILVLTFITYMVLAVLWSDEFDLDSLLYFTKCGALILILIWAIDICWSDRYFDQLLLGFLLSGAVVGLYSLFSFGVETGWRFDRVMKPVWHFANQNRMAKVFGVLALVALFLMRQKRFSAHKMVFLLSTVSLLSALFIIVLNRSTGAMLAVVAAIPCFWFMLLPYNVTRKALVVGSLCIFGVMIAGGIVYMLDLHAAFLQQGWSYRDEIWLAVLKDIVANPWFGLGATDDLPVFGNDGRVYSHEHNVFLAVLRLSGAIGLVLMLAVVFRLFWVLSEVRYGSSSLWLLILVFGLIALSSSGEYPIGRPKESWLFFWVPIAFLVAMSGKLELARRARRDGSTSGVNTTE